MLSLVLIKTRNAQIPIMKIRKNSILNRFENSTLWKIKFNLNPKAQAVNKAQRQLWPELYFPGFLKSLTSRRFKNSKKYDSFSSCCWALFTAWASGFKLHLIFHRNCDPKTGLILYLADFYGLNWRISGLMRIRLNRTWKIWIIDCGSIRIKHGK